MTAKYITIDEVAAHFSVSTSTIRIWIRKGYIPAYTYIKPGNTYRFNLPAVEAALLKGDKDDEVEQSPEAEFNKPEERVPYQLDLFNDNDEGDLS